MYNWRSMNWCNQTDSKKYDNGRNERNEKIRKLQEGFKLRIRHWFLPIL